jgi:hypothetical protein
MKFGMKRPCDLCPFMRNGLKLTPARALEIGGQIVDMQGRPGNGYFVCHKTAALDENDDYVAKSVTATQQSEHCAGALIFAEKQDVATQLMRIAERTNGYDRTQLDMTADVYDSLEEMVQASHPIRRRRHTF